MTAHPFLDLQAIDTALDTIGNRRPRLPEVAARQRDAAAVAEVRTAMATAQARIDAADASIAAAEHTAADLTARRSRLEAQLKTVIAPREAEALMTQIATLNARRSECDDEELAALDVQGGAEADLAALQERLPELEAALATSAAALDAAMAALDAEAADLTARRAQRLVGFAPDQLAAYDHVRKQFGGVGVAHLEGSHCGGCHMDLSPAELDIVKRVPVGELGECPQCGRILVR